MKLLLLLIISMSQFGIEQSFAQSSPGAIVSRAPSTLTVGKDWSPQTMSEIYGGEPATINKITAFIMDQTPISAVQFSEEIRSSFSGKAEVIASECKRLNEGAIWAQISCVSHSVNSTLKMYYWPNTSTFCRAHAQAFVETFRKLKIPRSQAFMWDGSTERALHVVNRVTLTDRNGKIFSYVIDVGWRPDSIFPLAAFTRDYHSKNGRKLPEVTDTEPEFLFQSTCENREGSARDFSVNLRSVWQVIQRALLAE